tara:strand:- start:1121 stop:1465 length:345 start_codon:yes stop_codon:yes gene_type:complete
MVVGAIATAVINAVFVIIAGFILISKILPKISDLIQGANVQDNRIISGVMGLLIIAIYILVINGVLKILSVVENQYLGYLNYLNEGVSILVSFLPYIQWIVVAALIGIFISKKK